MKELRIGIIGTGMISRRHMTVWSKIPGTKVVAGCDIDEKKVTEWGEKYKIPKENLYTDFREMLKRDDLDCIDVCVHNNLHTPVAVAVMKAGFPCYSEKPMAGSYADAKILYDAQKAYGQKLAIQISSIYNHQTRLAKQLIADGKLGKIYHARSVGHRREGRPGLDMPNFSRDFINKKSVEEVLSLILVSIIWHRCFILWACRSWKAYMDLLQRIIISTIDFYRLA